MQGATRRKYDGKNEAVLKTEDRNRVHSQSGHLGVYTKEKAAVHQSAALVSPSLASDTYLLHSQVISETTSVKSQICLKDLCSEDKRRIANLIEELARVSEEKEESVQRLKDEQGHFESKVQHLEQQNLVIMKERESLQQQYKECREVLGLYQKYLSQQQTKLNESIAQMSQAQAQNKVLNSDEAYNSASTTRANGLQHDGSLKARRHQVHPNRAGPAPSNAASSSLVSEISPSEGSIKRHRRRRKVYGEPVVETSYVCERCQSSGDAKCFTAQQWRSRKYCHEVKNHCDASETLNCERLQSETDFGSNAKETVTSIVLGHENWEEKRHQLLMQKMQLEMERERLHARLGEQEERLNRQNQQLWQSHFDYSRLQKAPQTELSCSNTRIGNPVLERPSCQDLPYSVSGEAAVERVPASVNITPPCELPTPSRPKRDVATSPPKSAAASFSKPAAVSVKHKTTDVRLDFSLDELLHTCSPVSAAEQSKSSRRDDKMTRSRLGFSAPRPVTSTLLTSGPRSTRQDLEESQILEDIFFIF